MAPMRTAGRASMDVRWLSRTLGWFTLTVIRSSKPTDRGEVGYGSPVPHRAGVYVHFLDSDDDPARVREAYGDATCRRLAEVKAKYDPDNVFHHNKNIRPSAPAP